MTGPKDLVRLNSIGTQPGEAGHPESGRQGGAKKSARENPELDRGFRADMYFRVIESHQVDGKNRVTVEYDGPSLQHLLHFFETAAEFAHQFRYKADSDLKAQERAKEWAASEPERKAHHAHILSLWRSMKGVKPTEKVHRIQATMKAQGRDYRSCDVYAIVSIALDDARKSKACPKIVASVVRDERKSISRSEAPQGLNHAAASPSVGTVRIEPDHRVRLVSVATHRREAGHSRMVHACDARITGAKLPGSA